MTNVVHPLCKARTAAGLTQGQLADRAGVISKQTISNIECWRHSPTRATVFVLALALNTVPAAITPKSAGR
jgi:transcriptional regulator with XRE-family HTH domain